MTDMAEPPPILKRDWTTVEGWRGTRAGMWAWLLQRAAALLLIVILSVHLRNPFLRWVQALLLAFVLLHGLLGLRAILLDLGLSVRWQKALFWLALAFSATLFWVVWSWWAH